MASIQGYDNHPLIQAILREDVQETQRLLPDELKDELVMAAAYQAAQKSYKMASLVLSTRKVPKSEVQRSFYQAAQSNLQLMQLIFKKSAFHLSDHLLGKTLRKSLADSAVQIIQAERPRVCFLEAVYKRDQQKMKETFGSQIRMAVWAEAYDLARKEDRPYLIDLLKDNFLQAAAVGDEQRLKSIFDCAGHLFEEDFVTQAFQKTPLAILSDMEAIVKVRNELMQAVQQNEVERASQILALHASDIGWPTWQGAYDASEGWQMKARLTEYQLGIECIDTAIRGDVHRVMQIVQSIGKKIFERKERQILDNLQRLAKGVQKKGYGSICEIVLKEGNTYSWILATIRTNLKEPDEILKDPEVHALLEAKREGEIALEQTWGQFKRGDILLEKIGHGAWAKMYRVARREGHDEYLRVLEETPLYRAGRKSPNSPRRSPSPGYSPRESPPLLLVEESEEEVLREEE